MLKVQSIVNDPVNLTAIIRFTEVFDDHPPDQRGDEAANTGYPDPGRGAERDQVVGQSRSR